MWRIGFCAVIVIATALASLCISFENIPGFFALSKLGDELQLLGLCVCKG